MSQVTDIADAARAYRVLSARKTSRRPDREARRPVAGEVKVDYCNLVSDCVISRPMHRPDAINVINMARAILVRHRGGYIDVDGYRELTNACQTLAFLFKTPQIDTHCRELETLARALYGGEHPEAEVDATRHRVLDLLKD